MNREAISIAEGFEQIIRSTRDLLGEVFDEIAARHRRGKLATHTPPNEIHRLMRLVDDVQEAANMMRRNAITPPSGTIEISGDHRSLFELETVGELLRTIGVVQKGWDKLRRSMVNASGYDHAVVALGLIQVVKNWGIHAELIPEDSASRLPDIRLDVSPAHPMHIEVKTKASLIDPEVPINYSVATKVIEAAMKSVGSSDDGQLNNRDSAWLAIGGYGIRSNELAVLKKAATDRLKKRGHKRKYLESIVFLSFDVNPNPSTLDPDGSVSVQTQWKCAMEMERVANPNYEGPIQIVEISNPAAELRGPNAFSRWNSVRVRKEI